MDLTLNETSSKHRGPLTSIVHRMIAVGDNSLAPLVDLALRLWVGMVFFNSGLTKIANWDSTLSLFQFEYQVPLLPPELAAWLGTGAELVLPLFLVLGLGGRLAAAALFAFNIVAVVSYPDLSELGLNDHQVWGLMLLATLARGPGKLSIDHFIRGRFEPRTGAHS